MPLSRSYTAGPGEPLPNELIFSCSGDMKTLAMWSRVLEPKPGSGAERLDDEA
jgi:hypothetical protein